MVKSGEKLNSNFLTFRYPGREPTTVKSFLNLRPDLYSLYIYDINLTTGTLLYSCAGGIGITKEPYIVDMHKFLKASTSVSAIKEVFKKRFGTKFLKPRYSSLCEVFNDRFGNKLNSITECAELYLLWVASGFTHRYKKRGYDSPYFPTSLDLKFVEAASLISRRKNLLFRKEDLLTLSESIINENVVVYCHLPTEFGKYGAGFRWNEETLDFYIKTLKEFDELGRKVCISATYKKYGRIYRDYISMFPTFNHVIIPRFKVSQLTPESQTSEIYLLNF